MTSGILLMAQMVKCAYYRNLSLDSEEPCNHVYEYYMSLVLGDLD
jgi:hypothetical protein